MTYLSVTDDIGFIQVGTSVNVHVSYRIATQFTDTPHGFAEAKLLAESVDGKIVRVTTVLEEVPFTPYVPSGA